jgi:hypothetical protein
MNAKTRHTAMLITIFVLLLVILYMLTKPQPVKRVHTRERVAVPVQIPMEREFRAPPIKEYKPRRVQQMGVLLGENNETLPLYGKEVRGRRDRYHYYTVTPGDQMYSLPVSMGERDCMDDIGCQEIYGNETVNILGQTGDYSAKLYRTDNFF